MAEVPGTHNENPGLNGGVLGTRWMLKHSLTQRLVEITLGSLKRVLRVTAFKIRANEGSRRKEMTSMNSYSGANDVVL